MVTEAPTLFPEPRDAVAPPGRGKHGYYRKPGGWIVVASTTPANRGHYEYKDFTFLPRYGEFAQGTGGGDAKERDDRGVLWNPADEPWRLIFQRSGAKEFPVEQIIAYRWHIRPPYREVKFPQLEGVNITDLPCPECSNVFSSINPREAAQFLRVHLTSKINGSHEYTPTDLRELAKEWGIDMETRRTNVAVPPAATLEPEDAVPVMEPADEAKNPEYQCVCGWAPPITSKNAAGALRFHQRKCKEFNAVPA